ncbi:MAG: ABC transporter ATP-binding protein [Chloroflexota bacterium]|nr:ABC transporter ATP-binding protein [Chloroflexota bacterium]
MEFVAVIETYDLTKQYGAFAAVSNLTLRVNPGELFGFLGPNGAGKSTTMKMLAGILVPTNGGARIAGYDVATQPLETKARLGYMAEEPLLYDKLTGREFLTFIADLYRVPKSLQSARIAQLLGWFDLTDKAQELIESYSRGMRQKIALAAALVHDPDVLILDEPTSGLDPRAARVVKDLLQDEVHRGKTVLMSTHILEVAEQMVSRVGIMDHGRLIAVGTLDDLRTRARAADASLEELFLRLTGGTEYHDFALAMGGAPPERSQ